MFAILVKDVRVTLVLSRWRLSLRLVEYWKKSEFVCREPERVNGYFDIRFQMFLSE
jgi:hypothetical protein